MSKQIFMCICACLISFFCASASAKSSDVNVDPLSLKIFPGINNYLGNSVVVPHIQKIGQDVFYSSDSDYFANDRLLYAKISSVVYEQTLSEAAALIKFQDDYNVISGYIESAEVANLISNAIKGPLTLDLKSIVYSLWDLKLRPELMTRLGISHSLGIATENSVKLALLDSVERLFKSAIDIIFLKNGISTVPAAVTPILKGAIVSKLGYVFLAYDATLNSVKLLTTLKSTVKVFNANKELTFTTLKMGFLDDYIRKYNSNLSEMKRALIAKKDTSSAYKQELRDNIQTFWGIWWLYVDVEGQLGDYLFDVKYAADEAIFNSGRAPLEKLGAQAAEVAELINNYGKNGLYSLQIKPQLKIDGDGYLYQLVKESNVFVEGGSQSYYYMPSNLSDIEPEPNFTKSKYKDYILEIAHGLTFFKAKLEPVQFVDRLVVENNATRLRYANEVRNYSPTMKVYTLSRSLIESQNAIEASTFYIPSYAADLPPKAFYLEHVADLFNSRIIVGQRDGTISTDQSIPIGEFLKTVTLTLAPGGPLARSFPKRSNISFTNYVDFLLTEGLVAGKNGQLTLSNEELQDYVTRGHVAKVIYNFIVANEFNQAVDCQAEKVNDEPYINDWDLCSEELKRRGYLAPNEFFNRDDEMSRGELFAIINRIKRRQENY